MMMRLAPFMAGALVLGGCTVPAAPEPEVAAGDVTRFPGGCRVRIEFGSYAMGIDADALARIEAALDADRAVTAVDRQRWGREGEVTLCATLASDAAARTLFDRLRNLLPATPRGPISLETRDGRMARAPARL